MLNGKKWLGHLENKQSGMIDLLILDGVYSVNEIAMKIKKSFPSVINSVARVLDHIKRLQTGDARGRASGMKPHYLKIIKDAAGKIGFDIS